MRSRCLRLLLAASLTLPLLVACAGPQTAPTQIEVLTPRRIIELTRQGVPPAEIIDRMEASGAVYVLTVADVDRLRAAGVSDAVIDQMLASCIRASWLRASSVKRSLWYREGQFYTPAPFTTYGGAYRFGD